MMRCNDCQSLMLDHRYGLLDAAEAASLDAHLAGCSACSAAYQSADRTQKLIARAAKSEFPQVRFAPPAEEVVFPFVKPRKARSSWVQWAVAASVLALIPGTLIPLSKVANRYETAKHEAEEAAIRTADAKAAYDRDRTTPAADARIAAAREKQLRVVSAWVNDAKSEAARKVSVDVTKPLAAQPGAPNDFVIAVADPEEALKGSRVEAQFRDQEGKVLYSQAVSIQAKNTSVRLPTEVWNRVSPQSELFLSVASVGANGSRTELQEPIRLFGPVYATMLVTDKSAYRPGEHLYFRSLTLDRITLRPPTREQNFRYSLRKADGSGQSFEMSGSTELVEMANGSLEPVKDASGQPIHGVGCGAFVLPTTLVDGEYFLTLTELPGTGGTPPLMASPVTRSIRVRSGAPERFTKRILFAAPSYNPGDLVDAVGELKLGEKPIAGARVSALVTVDGQPLEVVRFVGSFQPMPGGKPVPVTDETGRVRMIFNLPKILRGDVKVMLTFQHDGVEEAVAERLPVAGKDVVVEFFPESGKLLAGVPNRVYVRGTDSTGKPIDVRGTIAVAGGNELVARVEAPVANDDPGSHRGLGSFTFTPKAGTAYALRLQNPTAPMTVFELPKSDVDGVTFTALDTVVKPGQPIRLRVHSVGKDRKLMVGAYTRGRLADTHSVTVKANEPAIVTLLGQADSRGGVTRITVFEQPDEPGTAFKPVAERLVFRKPGEALNLIATASGTDTAVDLSIAATDEKGKPVPAILWAAAVNAASAPANKDRTLPTHFLLAGEVQTPDDLEYADFLLTDHPKAAESLDHVLATQGWRRFVEQSSAEAPAGSPVAAIHKLHGKQNTTATRSPLEEKYWAQFEAAVAELDAARMQKGEVEPMLLKHYADFESSRLTAQDLAAAVPGAATPYKTLRDRIPIAVGCVGVLSLMLGLLALARGMGIWGAMPYFVSTIAAAGLTAYLSLNASRHPITLPVCHVDPVTPPSFGNTESLPDVKLPPVPNYPYEVQSLTEKSTLFSLNVNKLIASPRMAPAGGVLKRSIPNELIDPKLPGKLFRAPPGGSVVESFLKEEQSAKEKSEALANETALATLRRIEAALRSSGAAADRSAERVRSATPRTRPLVVREYAAPRPGSDGLHPDADTVLWQPVIVLPSDGKTTLHFNLGDAPGGYQVIVAGHTEDGRLGSTRTHIPVR